MKAAKWLMENSPLFQSEGIYAKENWTDDWSRNVETHACIDDTIQYHRAVMIGQRMMSIIINIVEI